MTCANVQTKSYISEDENGSEVGKMLISVNRED